MAVGYGGTCIGSALHLLDLVHGMARHRIVSLTGTGTGVASIIPATPNALHVCLHEHRVHARALDLVANGGEVRPVPHQPLGAVRDQGHTPTGADVGEGLLQAGPVRGPTTGNLAGHAGDGRAQRLGPRSS